MNPKGAFRGSLGTVERSSTFVIFSRQPTKRGGRGSPEGEGEGRKEKECSVKRKRRGLAFFGFENRDELCFESSTIYTYTHTPIFTPPSIFASSLSPPDSISGYFVPLDHSPQISRASLYHVFNIPLFPLSDTSHHP